MKIALFSDIHANLPALEAFFKDLDTREVDQLYCLGDLVGYNIWPNEVINEIRNGRFPPLPVIMILVLEEQVMIAVVLIRLMRKKQMAPFLFLIPIKS